MLQNNINLNVILVNKNHAKKGEDKNPPSYSTIATGIALLVVLLNT
jgi:hypothetical protein